MLPNPPFQSSSISRPFTPSASPPSLFPFPQTLLFLTTCLYSTTIRPSIFLLFHLPSNLQAFPHASNFIAPHHVSVFRIDPSVHRPSTAHFSPTFDPFSLPTPHQTNPITPSKPSSLPHPLIPRSSTWQHRSLPTILHLTFILPSDQYISLPYPKHHSPTKEKTSGLKGKY